MATILSWFLENLSFWSIFVLMTIESSFIPFPSEVVVPPAAYLVAQGQLDGFGVILSAVLGSLVGALINYALAYYLGRPLIYACVKSKLGKMLLLSEEKLVKSEEYFDKKGAISTFIGRLIPGIRQFISIPAGLSKMHMTPFILYTLLGAGIWTCILFWLGWWAASIPEIDSSEKLIEWVSKYSHWIGYGILLLVALFIGIKFMQHLRKHKSN